MKKSTYDKLLAGVPPMIVIGAVMVLLPIFVLMTVQDINRQKENSIRLLLEKGAALIRSFEAGTRTGIMGMPMGNFKLQRLITETAQQPDIEYILVTDPRGFILAADNPDRIGMIHEMDGPFHPEERGDNIKWRMVAGKNNRRLFEVFRQFSPLKDPAGPRGAGSHRRMMMQRWSELLPERPEPREPQALMIFIGLDMSSIEAARKAGTRQTVIMAGTLLFVGFTGILLIFLAQSYRSAKTSLSRIRAFSDQVVENMPIGLVALDKNRRIASINRAAGTILGISPERAVGQPAQSVLPSDLLQPVAANHSGGGFVENEITCLTAEGRRLPLELSLSGLTDESGVITGSLLLFKDMTEVRSLRKEIAKNQRLVSMGKLAAGVAHEIRNPLSSIKGFATYFKEKYRKSDQDQQISTIMIQEVDRMDRVVSQLLDLAKPVTVNVKAIPAHELIENSLTWVEHRIGKKNIRAEHHLSPEVTTLYGDPDLLNQVLLNLYLNAIDAMDSNGVLSVALERSGEPRGIRIRVSDSGHGIPTADLPHVFDPYFTTKSGGTGLGLAIAHNIIHAHNGQIKAETLPQQGAVIDIFLPEPEADPQ